ncbi:MAG: hypothetical protein ACRDRI_24735 [Pseudonocardiaceae bacterium]
MLVSPFGGDGEMARRLRPHQPVLRGWPHCARRKMQQWAQRRPGAPTIACATAGEAASIIRRLDSPREQRLLADFRRAAAPYAGSAAVREFDAKHRDLLGASRA